MNKPTTKKGKPEPKITTYIDNSLLLLVRARAGFDRAGYPFVERRDDPYATPNAEEIEIVRRYREALKRKVAYLAKWLRRAEKELEEEVKI